MNNFPKIFLVDDDPFCLSLYEKELVNLGFDTVSAFSSGTALLSHLPENPDLIFLDYNLDNLTGLELLKKIKAFNPAISVVMISGQQDMEITIELMKQGAYDYVIKDELDTGKITRLIGRWLSALEFNQDMESSAISNSSENYLKLIAMAQDRVRSEISGELHDNVSQLLVASKLYMDVAFMNDRNRKAMIQESRLILDSAISEVRKLSHSLQAKVLQNTELDVELNKLISGLQKQNQFELYTKVELTDLHERLSSASQQDVFRIIQEMVNNINKYAKADRVEIRVELAGDVLQVEVIDNGIGFETDFVKKGLGLDNIIRRISNINGRYIIKTSPGKGCSWTLEIPLPA